MPIKENTVTTSQVWRHHAYHISEEVVVMIILTTTHEDRLVVVADISGNYVNTGSLYPNDLYAHSQIPEKDIVFE